MPGSGKSTYIKAKKPEFSGVCEEDFMKDSINHSPAFNNSRHFEKLVTDLQYGRDCIIADIEYCKKSKRNEVERSIRQAVPEAEIRWVFFKNDPEACKANVERRAKAKANAEKRKIDELSSQYRIPDDAREVLEVYRP